VGQENHSTICDRDACPNINDKVMLIWDEGDNSGTMG
jgi:hypothetical protein